MGQQAYKTLEYPVWLAKMEMVESCNFGDVVILGDSRDTAALLPSVLSSDDTYTNLALMAAGPVEAFVQLEHILKCSNHPQQIILSFSPQMMSEFPWFWSHDFGFFNWSDLHRIRAVEVASGQFELHDNHLFAWITDAVRDWMFVYRFPSFDFASAVQANWSRRWAANKAGKKETIGDRGYHEMGDANCAPRAGWEANKPKFIVSNLADVFLRRIIDDASDAGIRLVWISMPISDMTDSECPTCLSHPVFGIRKPRRSRQA